MKFGFIAHVNNEDELKMLRAVNHMKHLLSNMNVIERSPHSTKKAADFIEMSITSKCGATCAGKITFLQWYPQDILDKSEEAIGVLKDIALDLEAWGADVIGLGGYTAVVGGRGVEVQSVLKNAVVTTGNSFTASTSLETLYYISDRLGLSLTEKTIAIVGIPGSIALAVTRALLRTGANLLVVGRRRVDVLNKHLYDLSDEEKSRIAFTTNLNEALADSDIVFSATTTGAIIHQDVLKPGAIVIDIGEPKDMILSDSLRRDILVVDGGRFNFDEGVKSDIPLELYFRKNIFGCIGETILLSLENNLKHRSIGRILKDESVEAIRQYGHKHGFIVNSLSRRGQTVDDSELTRIKRFYDYDIDRQDINEHILSADKNTVLDKYGEHVNSVMVSQLKLMGADRLFVKAKGLYAWDSNGIKYYDFVGGYGAAGIGHNHPAVLNGLKDYLETSPPSLLQAAPGYYTSILSEKLTGLFPEEISRVFFCNSGAEAVEGALKLARIFTKRVKFASTKNSFHGKTFGALSVTGREKYEKYFKPLLENVVFAEYGNTDELGALLSNCDIAALIVEPIQGEGGVHAPPGGYLKKCLDLCHSYGTLLIVDEVMTGFGRTGRMFAFEHDHITPDIVTVAKTLGGSFAPIGAYLTKNSIWQESYGSDQKYLLHTSTFGGNNFCSSIALSTLNVLSEEKLVENAKTVGAFLIEGLTEISKDYSFIREVRGLGLLIGVEFQYNLDNGIGSLIKYITSTLSDKYIDLFSALPDVAKSSVCDMINICSKSIEQNLSESFAMQFSALLLNEHHIISIATLTNPYVLRLTPPLVITRSDAEYFLLAFRKTCEKIRILMKIEK